MAKKSEGVVSVLCWRSRLIRRGGWIALPGVETRAGVGEGMRDIPSRKEVLAE
jgi:hypothetical protein